MAQLVERLYGIEKVRSSILLRSTGMGETDVHQEGSETRFSRRSFLLGTGKVLALWVLNQFLPGQTPIVSAETPLDLELQTELERCREIIDKGNKSGGYSGELVEFRRAGGNESGAIEVSLSRQGSFSLDEDYSIFSGPSLSSKNVLLEVENTECPKPVSENSSPAFYAKAKWQNGWEAEFYGYRTEDLAPQLKEKLQTLQPFVYFCIRNNNRVNFQTVENNYSASSSKVKAVSSANEEEVNKLVNEATLQVTITQAFSQYRSEVNNLKIRIADTRNFFGNPKPYKVVSKDGVMIRSLPLVLEQNDQGRLTYGEKFNSSSKVTLEYTTPDGHKHYEIWVIKDGLKQKGNNFVCLYENEKDQKGKNVELGQYVK